MLPSVDWDPCNSRWFIFSRLYPSQLYLSLLVSTSSHATEVSTENARVFVQVMNTHQPEARLLTDNNLHIEKELLQSSSCWIRNDASKSPLSPLYNGPHRTRFWLVRLRRMSCWLRGDWTPYPSIASRLTVRAKMTNVYSNVECLYEFWLTWYSREWSLGWLARRTTSLFSRGRVRRDCKTCGANAETIWRLCPILD